MTEPAEELPEGYVRCPAPMWLDHFWACYEDSETRQEMREAQQQYDDYE